MPKPAGDEAISTLYTPKDEHQEKLETSVQKWTGIQLNGDDGLVVKVRLPSGKEGLDVYKLTTYIPETDTALFKASGERIASMPWQEAHALNCPIKSSTDWCDLYNATTGSHVVSGPKKLMTISEFNAGIKGAIPAQANWGPVSQKFFKNQALLDAVEAKEAREAKKAREAKEAQEAKEALGKILENLTNQPLHENELAGNGKKYGRRFIVTSGGDGSFYHWQGRDYCKSEAALVRLDDREVYRMYLQVDTLDIPRMVEILDELGTETAEAGGQLRFKFLLASTDDVYTKPPVTGEFSGLRDDDPRIAVYFNTDAERRVFANRLVQRNYDDMVAMAKKREGHARRPGSNVFFDPRTGQELRHINIGMQKGLSEDTVDELRATGVDWRDLAKGARTNPIT